MAGGGGLRFGGQAHWCGPRHKRAPGDHRFEPASGWMQVRHRFNVGRAIITPPTGGGGDPGPGTETLLTEFTWNNLSAVEQPTDWVNKRFGIMLPAGMLGANEFPIFRTKLGGLLCRLTTRWRILHPGGVWTRYIGVEVGHPVSVAGLGSYTAQMFSGGVAPAASGKTPASTLGIGDIGVFITGVVDLAGDYDCNYAQGLADGDSIRVDADGQAVYAVSLVQGFMQGGVDHGQLDARFRVNMVLNANGTVKGYRKRIRVQQFYCDVLSPTPTRRSFTGHVYNNGPGAVLRNLFCVNNSDGVTGSATVNLNHYSSFFTCDTDGEWDWVQGDGTDAADNTMGYPTFSPAFYMSSRMLLPWDLAIVPTGGTTVIDYRIMGRAPKPTNYSHSSDEVHPMPHEAARHFIRGGSSQNDWRTNKIAALHSAGHRLSLRRKATGQIVPVNDNAKSYTGLGTTQQTWHYRNAAAGSSDPNVGFPMPTSIASLFSAEFDFGHAEGYVLYPALLFCDEDLFDLQTERGGAAAALFTPGLCTFRAPPVTGGAVFATSSTRGITIGGVNYRHVPWHNGSLLARHPAGQCREMLGAWLVQPEVPPDGANVKGLFTDIFSDGTAGLNAFNASRPGDWQNNGLMMFRSTEENPWGLSLLATQVAWTKEATEIPSVVTLFNHTSKFLPALAAVCDVAAVGSFRAGVYDQVGAQREKVDEWMFECGKGSISYSSVDDSFTIGSGGLGNFNFIPQNLVDRIGFYDLSPLPFPEALNYAGFRVINAGMDGNPQKFQLEYPFGSLTPVTVVNSGSSTRIMANILDFTPGRAFQGNADVSAGSYFGRGLARASIELAAGAPNLADPRATMRSRVSAAELGYAGAPALAFGTTWDWAA